jgi:hypothetical protein
MFTALNDLRLFALRWAEYGKGIIERQDPEAVVGDQPFHSTTERTGGSTKGNAPHCTPKTAEFALLHAPPSTRLDEISWP